MSNRVVGFVILVTLSFGSQVKASPIYGIGNATPSTIFYVQGQSFTPSIAGNDGSGTPMARPDGSIFLTRLTMDFPSKLTPIPPSTLYIYRFAPIIAQVNNNGEGSIGVGTYAGGGAYAFNNLKLSFSSKYFAILPTSVSILDGYGNSYPGGVDLFPWNGRVQEGNGHYDIGFRAEFSTLAPEPSAFVLLCLGSLISAGFPLVRRGHLAPL